MVGGVGRGRRGERREQSGEGGCREPEAQNAARLCNRQTVVGHATLSPPRAARHSKCIA